MAHFQFVTVQGPPDKTSDKAAKRLARSHAVKQALQKKRQRQQESMRHFSVRTIEDEQEQTRSISRRQCTKRTIPSPVSLSASLLDPFQSLAVDSKRLHILLNDCESTLLFSSISRQGVKDAQSMHGKPPSLFSALETTFRTSNQCSGPGSSILLCQTP